MHCFDSLKCHAFQSRQGKGEGGLKVKESILGEIITSSSKSFLKGQGYGLNIDEQSTKILNWRRKKQDTNIYNISVNTKLKKTKT